MIPKPTERTGRLVRVSAQSLLVDVGDCLGSFVPACDVSSLCAGDFVSLSLHGETESSCRVVDNVALLARPEGVGEGFPSLNGDYLRINRDRRRQLLVQRANILAEIRCHFAERNFLEIEAPIVVPSPGLELHLQGFSVSDATGGVARKTPYYESRVPIETAPLRGISTGVWFGKGVSQWGSGTMAQSRVYDAGMVPCV